MKNLIKNVAIATLVLFSTYCFQFINSQEISSQSAVNQISISDEQAQDQQEGETYFVDLALVEKVSTLIIQVFKVF